MYPNYFFNAPTFASNKNLPGVREEPQYGEPVRATNTQNQSNTVPSNLLEYKTITPAIDDDINYTQGYLRTQIGKYVKVDFLIGTNLFIDKTGILRKVGISYIVLEETSGDMVMCDMYSIKFVTTLRKENPTM